MLLNNTGGARQDWRETSARRQPFPRRTFLTKWELLEPSHPIFLRFQPLSCPLLGRHANDPVNIPLHPRAPPHLTAPSQAPQISHAYSSEWAGGGWARPRLAVTVHSASPQSHWKEKWAKRGQEKIGVWPCKSADNDKRLGAVNRKTRCRIHSIFAWFKDVRRKMIRVVIDVAVRKLSSQCLVAVLRKKHCRPFLSLKKNIQTKKH